MLFFSFMRKSTCFERETDRRSKWSRQKRTKFAGQTLGYFAYNNQNLTRLARLNKKIKYERCNVRVPMYEPQTCSVVWVRKVYTDARVRCVQTSRTRRRSCRRTARGCRRAGCWRASCAARTTSARARTTCAPRSVCSRASSLTSR